MGAGTGVRETLTEAINVLVATYGPGGVYTQLEGSYIRLSLTRGQPRHKQPKDLHFVTLLSTHCGLKFSTRLLRHILWDASAFFGTKGLIWEPPV